MYILNVKILTVTVDNSYFIAMASKTFKTVTNQRIFENLRYNYLKMYYTFLNIRNLIKHDSFNS